MLASESGKSTDVRLVHSLKALFPMFVSNESDKTTETRLVQPSKA